MGELLYLHVPSYNELWYRQNLMQDSDTMSYNKNYTLDFEGYEQNTGCITFPEQKWADWYKYFIGHEPQRFYAYIARKDDDSFIGEVNLHRIMNDSWYEMGILLESKHRGNGYAKEVIWLLLRYAFEVMNVDVIHNSFEEKRSAAVHIHLSAGFEKYRSENGILELIISREQYFKNCSKRNF